jgi:hypothetical protein
MARRYGRFLYQIRACNIYCENPVCCLGGSVDSMKSSIHVVSRTSLSLFATSNICTFTTSSFPDPRHTHAQTITIPLEAWLPSCIHSNGCRVLLAKFGTLSARELIYSHVILPLSSLTAKRPTPLPSPCRGKLQVILRKTYHCLPGTQHAASCSCARSINNEQRR